MRRASYEWMFQKAFANTDFYIATPEEFALDAHGKPEDEWSEFRFLCRGDAQALQGEEAPSHRQGGSAKYRIYIPADVDIPARSLVRVGRDGEVFRVVGIPRSQPEGHGWTQVTLVDLERYEG